MDAREALRMWVRDAHIDAELAERLEQTLGVVEQPARSRAVIGLLVTVGSVLVGGGLLLFIASHWDEQSPSRRIVLLVGVYAAILAAAWLAGRRRLVTTARGLWLLSSLAVGVNIFLAGQIFNLSLNYWQGTLLWMIAALAMGWAESSEAQGWLVVVLGVLTLGWLAVPHSEFFDQGAFLFDEAGIRSLLPLIGLALAAGAMWATDTTFGFLRRPALSVGALLIAVPLTVSTFHPAAFAALFELDARWFHLVVVVLSVGVIASAWWFRRPGPMLGYAFAVLVVLLVSVLPQVGSSGGEAEGSGRMVSWLANPFDDSALLFGAYTAVIFALALATAVAGQHLDMPALVNTGVAVVGVICAGVYIGRLAGPLPTSIAVLVGGVILHSHHRCGSERRVTRLRLQSGLSTRSRCSGETMSTWSMTWNWRPAGPGEMPDRSTLYSLTNDRHRFCVSVTTSPHSARESSAYGESLTGAACGSRIWSSFSSLANALSNSATWQTTSQCSG